MAASDAPRGEGALEAAAREILVEANAVYLKRGCLYGLSPDDLVAIMRRHGLRGPSRLELEVAEIAKVVTPEMLREASERFVEKARLASERIARTPEESHE